MSAIQPVKPTMLMLLALFLLSFGIGSIRCATVPENSTDMLLLLEFKQTIAKNQGDILSYWNKSTPFCQWNGVTCATKHPGRVTVLNLTGQGLSGPIAPSVGNLTFLRILDLSANYFSGQIPSLSNLHKLEILDMSTNSLEGNFPDWLTNCSTLSVLDLSKNTLVGAIPPKIGLLSNLEGLGLSFNNFTGTIPPTLNNITNLRQMVIASNQLEGTIPSELGQLSNLQYLSLADNNLSGEIPHPFYNLSSLEVLSLRDNKLGKALAPDIGDKLPNLVRIFLQNNMFEDNIPASLGNASGIIKVDLSSNVFTGPVPSSFGKFSGLLSLNLDENDLEASDSVSWEFLHAMGNCSSLQVLSLAQNKLTGHIPDSIGNLSKTLQNLVLGGNKLSGIVPDSVGKLSGLILLTLDFNFLTGTIGEWIGKLKNLQVLILETNNFIGPIPSSIGNLAQLGRLQLRNNRFEGPIPPSLGSLSLLTSLDLSHNNLQGNIPLEIGMLRQLVNLTLSSNKLTGEIPDSLSDCKNLVNISMDQNFFTGEVPSFENVVGLLALNLSHNNLSGTIPKTLSDLELLKSLDLSYNHLYGEIPRNGVFADARSVSLGGNWELCGGTKDLHMPPCPSPTVSPRMSKQYYLIRILIPIFGFMSLALLIYFLILEKKKPRRKYSEQTSFGENFLKVSYNDLAQATTDFSESNLIGRGAHGSVYRGRLKEPKVEVAVKVFNLEMHGAERSFLSECEALRSIQHRNLLPIITACSTVDQIGNVFKALVYEFMPNGSLDSWLHHRGDGKASKGLSLAQRMSIAVNVADALDYLHHDCGRPTVHCDLKPSNILLDDDMTALLGDFGIARFYVDTLSTTAGSVNSIGLKGTIGYIAPEYAHGGHVSTSGDVYSFGIVLLEMITGKRPTDPMFKDGLDIINYVNSTPPHQVFDVVDAHLKEEGKNYDQTVVVEGSGVYECLVSLLELARSCTRPLPSERANMKQIASKVHTIRTSYLGWKQKKTDSLD